MAADQSGPLEVSPADPGIGMRKPSCLGVVVSGTVGGVVAVVLSAIGLFVVIWATGFNSSMRGDHFRPSATASDALKLALELMFLAEVILGLPVFLVGFMVGALWCVKRGKNRANGG
jgi:hypothetical protein